MDSSHKHFLDLDQIDSATVRLLLDKAHDLKKNRDQVLLPGKTLAMIFEKPSTRTRVSFEVGIKQLGGHAIVLTPDGSQLGRGETIADTARVLSRYVDLIMIRTDRHDKLLEMARYARIPVINGLTDRSHPCQIMADIMAFEEHRGRLDGKIVTWVGDGNNVASSWIQAAAHIPFEMRIATPAILAPNPEIVEWARSKGARISVTTDPIAAVQGSHCVMTDTWISMGQEKGNRFRLLEPFQVTLDLMRHAHDDAVFMHCLPAHREEEVTSDVIDGPQSIVWDEAENRLHIQKAIMAWCMGC